MMHAKLPVALAAWTMAFAWSLFATAEPLTVESFARLPAFAGPAISPDGKLIAAIIRGDGLERLAVYPLDSPGGEAAGPVRQLSPGELQFQTWDWASNDILIISASTTKRRGAGYMNVSQLLSYNYQNEELVRVNVTSDGQGKPQVWSHVINYLEDDSEHILAAVDRSAKGWSGPQVHAINVRTGKKQRKARNTNRVFDWFADEQGRVRAGLSFRREGRGTDITTHLFHRSPATDTWREILTSTYFDYERLIPVRFDYDDPNVLLMRPAGVAWANEHDGLEQDLLRFNLERGAIGGSHKDVRIDDAVSWVRRRLPGQRVELKSHDRPHSRLVFRVHSDIDAPVHIVFDAANQEMTVAGAEYPQLADVSLAGMSETHYEARDGMRIPAYLTLPPGRNARKLPVVVLVHGGRHNRDRWGFDHELQFLANQGYAVFQPQFRGSSGFGRAHLDAGAGQWGRAIPQDIEDGVRSLIDQGVADPDRICIAGHDFGGYLALISAIRQPDLYRCLISVNGATDLALLLDRSWNSLTGSIEETMWESPNDVKDASPYHLAKHLRAPLLLLHGERNTYIPIRHSRKLQLRLKDLKKNVRLRELPRGEAWRSNDETEIALYTEIAGFLHEHIGD